MLSPAIRTARSFFGVALLLLGVTACAESSDAGSATPTTSAASTTASTAAPSSTTTSTTTEPTTTTAAPRTIVATGTWADLPETSFSTAVLPSGYTWLGEDLAFDGDLVGTTLYDIGISPVSDSGMVTSYADGTFRGTLVGVGDGTLAWSEPEKDVSLPAAPGSAPMVGVSGAFLGATGTFSWAYTDGSHGTYEVRLTWD